MCVCVHFCGHVVSFYLLHLSLWWRKQLSVVYISTETCLAEKSSSTDEVSSGFPINFLINNEWASIVCVHVVLLEVKESLRQSFGLIFTKTDMTVVTKAGWCVSCYSMNISSGWKPHQICCGWLWCVTARQTAKHNEPDMVFDHDQSRWTRLELFQLFSHFYALTVDVVSVSPFGFQWCWWPFWKCCSISLLVTTDTGEGWHQSKLSALLEPEA